MACCSAVSMKLAEVPLAGDVYAAAVILDPSKPLIAGLNDSKKMTEKKRESLFAEVQSACLAYCVASATVAEIEELNILGATMLAMQRAVAGLSVQPQLVLVDGNRLPQLTMPAETVVKGDATSASIAAASILAKVSRDRTLYALDEQYPRMGLRSIRAMAPRHTVRQSYSMDHVRTSAQFFAEVISET